MPRLLDRQKQIPGGLIFYEPSTKWKCRPWSSFDQVVRDLIAHRLGNPALIEKNKWKTDYESVANEVDEYNALRCFQMGWNNFIVQLQGASPPPKSMSPHQQSQVGAVAGRVKKIWAGVKTSKDWIDSGDPPVPIEQSERRAVSCSGCQENGAGDWTKWFTVPASEAIKRQLEILTERNLHTSLDDKINICETCLCPLKLKVHTPLVWIKKHLSNEVFNELSAVKTGCWIIQELRS